MITTTSELKELVKKLEASTFLAVDTEFLREKTYFARLCLIQIADDAGNDYLVDPLAIEDLSPLRALFCESDITKVFHAGSQDYEIFYQALGAPVGPVFDTQSAATLLGHCDQTGYGALVQAELDVTLSKADGFTDWSRRPLSDAQLAYARDDVIYLAQLYPVMLEKLAESGRSHWLDEEFASKSEPELYQVDFEQVFRRVKRASSLKGRALGNLSKLASWREHRAQKMDLPRKWVCSDETLIELARRAPRTLDEVKQIRGVSAPVIKNTQEIFRALNEAAAIPQEELPVFVRHRRVPCADDAGVDLMMALVHRRAKDNNIAVSQLASRTLCEELISDREQCELMHGWRRTLIGEELCSLLDGKLSLTLEDATLVIEPRREE